MLPLVLVLVLLLVRRYLPVSCGSPYAGPWTRAGRSPSRSAGRSIPGCAQEDHATQQPAPRHGRCASMRLHRSGTHVHSPPVALSAASRSAIWARLRATLAARAAPLATTSGPSPHGCWYRATRQRHRGSCPHEQMLAETGHAPTVQDEKDHHAERTVGSPGGGTVCPVGPSLSAIATPPAMITNRVGRRSPLNPRVRGSSPWRRTYDDLGFYCSRSFFVPVCPHGCRVVIARPPEP
jgi:hypothetical protein